VTVKSAKEASPAIKKLIKTADGAIGQKNWGYAFQILREVLLQEPGLNEARFKLREAQLDKIGRKASMVRQLTAAVSTAFAVKAKGPAQLKKGDFAKALDTAEKAMEADPTVLPTLKYLCKAAEQAGLPEVAVNALEVAVEFHPKSASTIRQLAELYEKNKQGHKAVTAWQKFLAIQPNSLEAQNRLKHATALAAMEQANWEGAESFRDVMTDADKQELMEVAGRGAARDEETRVKLINSLVDQLEEDPNSIGNFRKLAELYHQNGNYDEAIECYGRVTELTQTKDPAIDSAITTILEDKYNQQIKDLRAQLEAEPDNGEAIEQAIAQLEGERDETLLNRYRQRVENYPNEPQFRMALGELLQRDGKLDAALEQLQHAQRSAHHAPRASHLMGQCFTEKGLHDLAIEQFRNALEHRERMRPPQLKALLYDLASVHEAKGDGENALAALKELYAMDVSYRDVAERIERSYKQ
jgi:tetratricopeptide (TPR) repeat protein